MKYLINSIAITEYLSYIYRQALSSLGKPSQLGKPFIVNLSDTFQQKYLINSIAATEHLSYICRQALSSLDKPSQLGNPSIIVNQRHISTYFPTFTNFIAGVFILSFSRQVPDTNLFQLPGAQLSLLLLSIQSILQLEQGGQKEYSFLIRIRAIITSIYQY